MTNRLQFGPLCDVHHTSMQRLMLEEDSELVRSFHACSRSDCTRIFRDEEGYADIIAGQFDASRAAVRNCPLCGSALYLAKVDQIRKVETWECPRDECDHAEELRSPAAR